MFNVATNIDIVRSWINPIYTLLLLTLQLVEVCLLLTRNMYIMMTALTVREEFKSTNTRSINSMHSRSRVLIEIPIEMIIF